MKLSTVVCAFVVALTALAMSAVGITAAFAVTECPPDCVLSGGFCYCKLPQDTLKPTPVPVPELGTDCSNGGVKGTISAHEGNRVCGIPAKSFTIKGNRPAKQSPRP